MFLVCDWWDIFHSVYVKTHKRLKNSSHHKPGALKFSSADFKRTCFGLQRSLLVTRMIFYLFMCLKVELMVRAGLGAAGGRTGEQRRVKSRTDGQRSPSILFSLVFLRCGARHHEHEAETSPCEYFSLFLASPCCSPHVAFL